MRTIKFRAWEINWQKHEGTQGRMLEVLNVQNGFRKLEENQITTSQLFDEANQTNYVPLQFTGLLDKNGKEIYEGDILSGSRTVEYENGGFTVSEPANRIKRATAEKEWRDKGNEFMAYGVKNSHAYLGLNVHLEVLGNIYENPELLK